jgi:hypothetical protein
MARKPTLFAKIRARVTRTGKQAKFAAVKLGADLSSFVPAPQPLLKRLGIKKAFVPAGVRPTVRSPVVTPAMLSKARLEAEEGARSRPLKPKEFGVGRDTSSHISNRNCVSTQGSATLRFIILIFGI